MIITIHSGYNTRYMYIVRILPCTYICTMYMYMVGPGEYESKDTLGKGKPGLLCQRDERFKPIGNRVPGPGAYTVSQLHTCS